MVAGNALVEILDGNTYKEYKLDFGYHAAKEQMPQRGITEVDVKRILYRCSTRRNCFDPLFSDIEGLRYGRQYSYRDGKPVIQHYELPESEEPIDKFIVIVTDDFRHSGTSTIKIITTIRNNLDFSPEEDAEFTMHQISRTLTKDDIVKIIRENELKKLEDHFTKYSLKENYKSILVFTDPETNLTVVTNNYYGIGRPSYILKVNY